MDLPSIDVPSIEATSRALPQKRASRRYVIPALIVLALVTLGIGIALLYRGHWSSVTQSQTPSNVSPETSSVSPAPPVAGSATTASSGPAAAALAPPGAVAPASKPPAVDQTKPVSPVQASPRLAILRPLPKAAADMADNDNCPYPRTAIDQGLTGTVLLLVHVASDGRPMTTKMDKSSGSDVLDQAAVQCVEQFGRFAAATDGSSPEGYWGLVRFKWFFDM